MNDCSAKHYSIHRFLREVTFQTGSSRSFNICVFIYVSDLWTGDRDSCVDCYHNCVFTISHTVLKINTRYILCIIYCLWSMPIFVCICISYLPWCSVIFDIFILVHGPWITWSNLAVYFCIVLIFIFVWLLFISV